MCLGLVGINTGMDGLHCLFKGFWETVMVTHGRMCELDFSNLAGIGDDRVMLASYDCHSCVGWRD